jgi:hypothetical protein
MDRARVLIFLAKDPAGYQKGSVGLESQPLLPTLSRSNRKRSRFSSPTRPFLSVSATRACLSPRRLARRHRQEPGKPLDLRLSSRRN